MNTNKDVLDKFIFLVDDVEGTWEEFTEKLRQEMAYDIISDIRKEDSNMENLSAGTKEMFKAMPDAILRQYVITYLVPEVSERHLEDIYKHLVKGNAVGGSVNGKAFTIIAKEDADKLAADDDTDVESYIHNESVKRAPLELRTLPDNIFYVDEKAVNQAEFTRAFDTALTNELTDKITEHPEEVIRGKMLTLYQSAIKDESKKGIIEDIISGAINYGQKTMKAAIDESDTMPFVHELDNTKFASFNPKDKQTQEAIKNVGAQMVQHKRLQETDRAISKDEEEEEQLQFGKTKLKGNKRFN